MQKARTIVETVCDECGVVVDEPMSVGLTVEGRRHVLDVCPDHLAKYREMASHGRVVEDNGAGAVVVPRDGREMVRAWARKNGYAVADRGNLKTEVVRAYKAAQANGAQSPRRGKVNR